tara:strand:+ start:5046 stop:7046 length:2001 start_codon:yes stop_codon:yes gene_type:complete
MAVDKNELILQFKFLAQKANAGIDGTNRKLGGLRQSTAGIRRSVGALRNNLLLVSFAFAGVTASIGKLISASSRFEAVKTRLVGLTGSVKEAEKAFNNFNQVAATTPFSLEDVVGAGAQLQAFGADANALIKPITDLAAFMGTTAVEAANAFGRAFAGGAGAADILRERGILNIIKSSQGIADLSKTTLPEFRQALISAMQDPVVGIQGSTDRMSKTFQGATSNMLDSLTRLAAASGSVFVKFTDLKGSMVSIGESVSAIAKQLDFIANPIENLTARLSELGLEAKNLKQIQSILESKETRDAITKEDALIVSLTEDLRKFAEIAPLFERNLSGIEDFMIFNRGATNVFKGNLDDLSSSVLNLQKRLQESLKTEETAEGINKTVTTLEKLKRILGLLQIGKEESPFQPMTEDAEILSDMDFIDPFESQLKDLRDLSLDEAEAFVKGQVAKIDSLNQLHDVAIDNEGFFAEMAAEQEDRLMSEDEMFRNRIELRKEDLVRIEESKKKEIEAMRERAQVFKRFSDNIAFAVVNGQNLGDAVVNSIKAIAAELIAQQATLGLLKLFGFPGATAAEAGLGLLGSAKKLFGFHEGGFIGGGGNNVPIIAQSGEFVMQRSAVQSIGLDNLSNMNETGQAGNITVNIHGGIVQEDYLRNELIPAINRSGVRVA